MSRKNVPGSELIDAYRQEQAVLATETGQKYLELLKKHVSDVLAEELATEHVARIKSVKKYLETPLTKEDQDKIDLIDTQNAEIDAEIEQIHSQIMQNHAEEAAKAFTSGDTASIAKIMQQIDTEKTDQTKDQVEKRRLNVKVANALRSKQDDAGIAVYVKEQDIREENDTGTGGSGKYAFEGCQFWVESPKKTSGFSVDSQIDVDTRRIFVKCIGKDWAPEFRGEKYHFAGFYGDFSEKKKVTTRSKLEHYVDTWIDVAERAHPRKLEDLYEITNRTNKRAELGNLSQPYSKGANDVYRLVETIESDEKDVEHQRLRANYLDPGWNELDQHKATIQALIDAEVAGDDTEQPAKAEESPETAKSDSKSAKADKKAA